MSPSDEQNQLTIGIIAHIDAYYARNAQDDCQPPPNN